MYIITKQYNTPVTHIPTYWKTRGPVSWNANSNTNFNEKTTHFRAIIDDLQYFLNIYIVLVFSILTPHKEIDEEQKVFNKGWSRYIQVHVKYGNFSKHTIFLSISMYIYTHCQYIYLIHIFILYFNCVCVSCKVSWTS